MRFISGSIVKYFFAITLVFVWSVAIVIKAQAQDATGVALPVPLDRDEVADGSLICTTSNGYNLCNEPYSGGLFGIVNKNPPISFQLDPSQAEGNIELVLTSGTTSLRVNSSAGNISSGDLLTSSETEGVAMKAERNGFVLGIALQSYESDNPDVEGTILASVDVHPSTAFTNATGTGGNLLAALRQGLSASIFEPLASLRYVLAALLILIAFTLGFIYFGRLAQTGVEALGRNPLAGGMIKRSIFLHIVITIIIVLTGLFGAYIVLIL